MTQFQQNNTMRHPIPNLPTELWLDILEHTVTRDNADFLWCTVRRVSRQYKAYVERLFETRYLLNLTISLGLPLRDTTTGALLWPGEPIPGRQLKMAYKQLKSDGQTAVLTSPVVLRDNSTAKSVEELRNSSTLTKERLQAAPAWVSLSSSPMKGCIVDIPVRIEWDGEQKIWVWELRWRELVSKFCNAKQEKRAKSSRNGRTAR
jgi:hypothetical protein